MEVLAYPMSWLALQLGTAREVRPRSDRGVDVVDDCPGCGDGESVREAQEVVAANVVEDPVDAHEVAAGPLTRRVVGMRHVVGGRKVPSAGGVKRERVVLGVVVAVRCGDVEDGTTERLFAPVGAEPEVVDHAEERGVVVGVSSLKVEN